jgi:hypothetical protein
MQLRTWLYLKDVSKYGRLALGLTSGMTAGYFNVAREPVYTILFDHLPKLIAADDDV